MDNRFRSLHSVSAGRVILGQPTKAEVQDGFGYWKAVDPAA